MFQRVRVRDRHAFSDAIGLMFGILLLSFVLITVASFLILYESAINTSTLTSDIAQIATQLPAPQESSSAQAALNSVVSQFSSSIEPRLSGCTVSGYSFSQPNPFSSATVSLSVQCSSNDLMLGIHAITRTAVVTIQANHIVQAG